MHEDMKSLSRRIASLLSSNPNLKLRDIARFIGANRHNIEHAVKTQYGFRFQELKKMARLKYIRMQLEGQPSPCIKEMAAMMDITPNSVSRFIKSTTGNCARELLRHKR